MLPKPSLVLQAKLMPEDYSEAQAAEIKRSYMYLAQSIVSELGEDERGEGNLMRLNVRLMKPFWNPAEEGADELWRRSFMPWLANATRNLSTAMHNFNTVLHPLGAGNVTYEWADFDFSPHAVLRLKVDDENCIPAVAPELCDRVRELAAASAFDEDVALIRIPSRASIAAQEEAFAEELRRHREALAAREAADAAAVATLEGADAAVAAAADEADDVASANAIEMPAATVPADADGAAAPDVETTESVVVLSEPEFELDYSIWGLERADGTVVEFDSRTA
ncbi:hypothetical protein [uncultured Adlercreutzia sp.]|uniref:hypothetical protein n=1 Tax=uncultured Adlercreutzia sp. TaxID=875803 RepID=UPI002675FC80|nr:hypothetical protein [uncultured Adlercreutzia sp.]